MPLLRQSPAGRIVNVSTSLSKALADTPIKVNAVCPGFVQTDLTPVNRDKRH